MLKSFTFCRTSREGLSNFYWAVEVLYLSNSNRNFSRAFVTVKYRPVSVFDSVFVNHFEVSESCVLFNFDIQMFLDSCTTAWKPSFVGVRRFLNCSVASWILCLSFLFSTSLYRFSRYSVKASNVQNHMFSDSHVSGDESGQAGQAM